MQDSVYALATSPNFAENGICFAACVTGLYRSDDGGITWRSAYDSLELDTVLTTAVAISPVFDADQTVFAGLPGSVLRSFDGGESWHVAPLPPPPPTISSLALSPNFVHDGVVLAGTVEDGVFRSADRGVRWARWNFGLLDLNVLAMAISPVFAKDETLFIGTESGIFRSTNGGRAWREVDFPTAFGPVISLQLSPNFSEDGILYAGTESHGLFVSSDRGKSWSSLGDDTAADSVNAIVLAPEFAVKKDLLIASGARLLISHDGGHSWSDWKAGLPTEQGILSIAAPQGIEPGAPLLIGLIDGGVLRI